MVVEPGPGSARLLVQDSDIGIPAEVLPRLCERFTLARRPGLRGERTTDLGLVLCKTIVDWHKGTSSVASQEGQGTAFTVEIPQAD